MVDLLRFIPAVDLDIGGAVLVELDLISANVDFSVTDKVPAITLELNDASKKFTDLPLHWNDPITLAVNGSTRFLGRVDSLVPSYDKKGARILTVRGRHTGSAALEDYVTNLQVTGTPAAIVAAIIARYNSMRGSVYISDPTIAVASNLAPTDITMEFDWRRKNFWKMFDELQQALGAPVLEGGKDEFYDFYLNPVTAGDFYFVPMGSIDSAVTIAESTEILKAKRVLDGTPLKNDVWLWCNAKSGAVPFEMQEGWNTAQHYAPPVTDVTDPWTEDNASDFDGYNNSEKPAPTIANNAADYMIGAGSIEISGMIGAVGGGGLASTQKSAYWYMNFAHGGNFHTKLDGFTNQDPNDMLNLSNETHMAESMGEVSAISFYLKTLSESWPFELQCVDVDNHRARGSTINSKQTSGIWYNPFDLPKSQWVPVVMPIGPSAGDWQLVSGDTFDWTSIKQIRFVFGGKTGPFDFLFDGFKFVKPLIANAIYVSGEAIEKTCRSTVIAKEKIDDYEAALLIAQATLEQQKEPNVAWSIDNLGRVDIPSGSKFQIGTLELLMRDQRWNMTKEGGWTITAEALEKT